MRILKAAMVVTMALIWVPLMLHCPLEALTGFEVLRCEDDTHHEADTHHEDEETAHGCDDACCSVEFAQYYCSRPPDLLPVGDVVMLPWMEVDFSALFATWHGSTRADSPGPPEETIGWQFLCRAAKPARAPSILS